MTQKKRPRFGKLVKVIVLFGLGTLLVWRRLPYPSRDAHDVGGPQAFDDAEHHRRDELALTFNLSTNNQSCSFTKEDPGLTTDSNGHVCDRGMLGPNGCCKTTTVPGGCSLCTETFCCRNFEHCVACCTLSLTPNAIATALSKRLQKKNARLSSFHDHQISASASTTLQFESCKFLCRTNSASVQHENKYRNTVAYNCFGGDQPQLVKSLLK
eukprot:m.202436 g.202436  ORF g.202436 m.202436 type:complete len:212 (-) comp32828_c0_seq2:194-829(-)